MDFSYQLFHGLINYPEYFISGTSRNQVNLKLASMDSNYISNFAADTIMSVNFMDMVLEMYLRTHRSQPLVSRTGLVVEKNVTYNHGRRVLFKVLILESCCIVL